MWRIWVGVAVWDGGGREVLDKETAETKAMASSATSGGLGLGLGMHINSGAGIEGRICVAFLPVKDGRTRGPLPL